MKNAKKNTGDKGESYDKENEMDVNKSGENKESGDEQEFDEDINEASHGKPIDNIENRNLNSKNETDTSVESEKKTS